MYTCSFKFRLPAMLHNLQTRARVAHHQQDRWIGGGGDQRLTQHLGRAPVRRVQGIGAFPYNNYTIRIAIPCHLTWCFRNWTGIFIMRSSLVIEARRGRLVIVGKTSAFASRLANAHRRANCVRCLAPSSKRICW